MAVKKIGISNFKSFKDVELELGNFNVLIGPNASGKSNFIDIFRFLRDIASHGLHNAVSMQGGAKYLKNLRIGSSHMSLRIVYDPEFMFSIETEGRLIMVKSHEVVYEFAIQFVNREEKFEVSKDKLVITHEFFEVGSSEETEEVTNLGLGEFIFSNIEGKLEYDLNFPENVPIAEGDIFPTFLKKSELLSRTLLLETPFFASFLPFRDNFFNDISIYDFDPGILRKTAPIAGKMELEDDGSNLAIVLENIMKNKEKKRKFSNLIAYLLPFVDGLTVEKFSDKSLRLKFRETYTPEHNLPASAVSEGTINVIALIVAIYFEEKPLIIIEEPGKNVHPLLISRVVDMLKEVSQKKQIIITTHNPEIVKHADLEDLLLICRDKEGFSTISRPCEKEGVKTFLENEIGIEDLYIQDLLGV